MPRKKTKKLAVSKKRFDVSKWTQSYSSFLLGIVAVIVVVLFGVSLVRQGSHVQQTSSLSTGPTATVSPTPGSTVTENGQRYYIVKANDSLWNVAITIYNDGYKWSDIAKANNLTNPDTIYTGDKLLLPNTTPGATTFGQLDKKTLQQNNSITGTSYTVQKGDTLWDIAVKAYADGYQWTKIAQANHLDNPDLIFSGNVLILPR